MKPLAARASPPHARCAVGVVYGRHRHQPAPHDEARSSDPASACRSTRAHIIGAVSTIFWGADVGRSPSSTSLLILRADNQRRGRHHGADGAGGALGRGARRRAGAVARPACSARPCSTATASSPRRSRCLARPKGLEVVAPSLKPWVLPISVGVLLGYSSSCGASAPAASSVMFRPGDRALVRHPRRRRRHGESRPGTPAILSERSTRGGRSRLQVSRLASVRRRRRLIVRWRTPAPGRSMPAWAASDRGRVRIAWRRAGAAGPWRSSTGAVRAGCTASRSKRVHRSTIQKMLVIVLRSATVADRTEVIAEMKIAGRLNAGKNSVRGASLPVVGAVMRLEMASSRLPAQLPAPEFASR